MVRRSLFVVMLLWGMTVATDAAQVGRDSSPLFAQVNKMPGQHKSKTNQGARDINPLPRQLLRGKQIQDNDETLMSELALVDPPHAEAGSSPGLQHLLRLASGAERLDPAAFVPLLQQLRADMRNDLNNSMRDIEGEYEGHINEVAECATTHGFQAPNARHAAYIGAKESYGEAVDDSDQKCQTRTTRCDDQRLKALALHNFVQNDIISGYSQSAPPTVFGLLDFYLREIDDVASTVNVKHGAWKTAAGLCSSAQVACSDAEQVVDDRCGDVNEAAENGRSDYNGCYQQKEGVLDGYDVDGHVANQMRLVENLEKVLCIVEVAVDSHGDNPIRDSEMTCSDSGAPTDGAPNPGSRLIKYECVCRSPSSPASEKYSESYIVQLTLKAVPDRHTDWEPLGCANSQISTTLMPVATTTATQVAGSQFFKIVVTENGGSSFTCMDELQIKDATGNVAAVRTSTSSPTRPRHGPEKLHDGLIGGQRNNAGTPSHWCASEKAAWAELELETPIVPRTYSIYAEPNAEGYNPATWKLFGSDDGQNWQLLDTESNVIEGWEVHHSKDFVISSR